MRYLIVMLCSFQYLIFAEDIHFLGVSIEKYACPLIQSLPGFHKDVDKIVGILEKQNPEIKVTILKDEKATGLMIIAALESVLSSAAPESTVIIFFNMHGYWTGSPNAGSHYLIPYDMEPFFWKESSVPFDRVVECLFKHGANKRILLFMQTCFSGQMVLDIKERNRKAKHLGPLALNQSEDPSLKIGVFTSSCFDEVSWAIVNIGGLFGIFVSRALSGAADVDQNSKVDLGEIAAFVERNCEFFSLRFQNTSCYFSESLDNYCLSRYEIEENTFVNEGSLQSLRTMFTKIRELLR